MGGCSSFAWVRGWDWASGRSSLVWEEEAFESGGSSPSVMNSSQSVSGEQTDVTVFTLIMVGIVVYGS